MVKYGYVIVVVERLGNRGLFGKLDLSRRLGPEEANEILNWIASQAWSDGNIGMFGDSIQAQIQFQAASTGNPHLKAILPATTWWDNYSSVLYPGGIRDQAFLEFYYLANTTFDRLSTPVDRDPNGELLAQARKERQGNALADITRLMPEVLFRDDQTPEGKRYWEEAQSLVHFRSDQPVGDPRLPDRRWFDIYARR
jgi:putative CocE/NonD family hydrolase